ncbi:hypothetical protein PENSPDRAFT_578598 [Peniophora sp. CONT]|nr:hypothetical protein PENSPDRAFT_578598 [Peniophora sp. CONT]
MPPQSTSEALHLEVLPGIFSVTQLSVNDALSDALIEKLRKSDGKFMSITRTDEEVSVVEEVTGEEEAVAEWKCIKIRGPMDFGLTGILHDLSTPLKAAEISIFALSTWYVVVQDQRGLLLRPIRNTDYVLVKKDKTEDAVRVLSKDGWHFATKN